MTKLTPSFHPIDFNTWPRKAIFNNFFSGVVCSGSMTLNVEISRLLTVCKERAFKLYPTIIYIISKVMHQISEHNVEYNQQGTFGHWNFLSPCYTVFHEDDKTFSNLWTTFQPEFSDFHADYLADVQQFGESKEFYPKPQAPENLFYVTCAPWLDFNSLHVNISGEDKYLRPMFTVGKYTRQNDQVTIPITVRLHHAAHDGYHASVIFNLIREYAAKPEEWI